MYKLLINRLDLERKLLYTSKQVIPLQINDKQNQLI